MLTTLIIGFIWYQIIAVFGISAGIHRYFSHKQFRAGPIYEWIALYMVMLAGARSPIGWVGAHRIHHMYADTEKDPHSPDHQGWLKVVFNLWTVKSIPRRYVKDCLRNPRIMFFHRHWWKVLIATSVIAYYIHWQFFVGFVVVPYVLGFLGYGLFNYLGHKNFAPRNNWIINILAVGEGFHEPHHQNVRRIRLHKWDITGWVIERLFEPVKKQEF
jgi:stearoyl-CoA desaturase (delta-9 desaturase)